MVYSPDLQNTLTKNLVSYYNKDTQKAKALLAEAGYPNGFEFTITVPSNYQYHVDTAQILVDQLSEIGVTAKIKTVEWAAWLSDTYSAREYEATSSRPRCKISRK